MPVITSKICGQLRSIRRAAHVEFSLGKIRIGKKSSRPFDALDPEIIPPASDLTVTDIQFLYPYIRWSGAFREDKPWREAREDIDLAPSLRRDMETIHAVKNDFGYYTRRTPLDYLIRYVHSKFELESPGKLHLKTRSKFFERIGGVRGGFMGVPYYTLWHGTEDVATNFVVVHTEKPAWYDATHILAYMAMIHTERRRRQMTDCTMYGLSTNSKEFWFYQLDNESRWSYLVLKPEEDYSGEVDYAQEIAGLLTFIFHEAVVLSQGQKKRKGKGELNVVEFDYRI
ncbi:hypothetical protein N7495_008180 [Penicillium taxi]|uniref:uncharacterized protein n=1 Tax=Penicillium taxi TaxID=168475 RepID=UPI0025456262|nr:uncharacterized protein N7495_008180 [Penicillium taxi]KAJ5888139.1 hypothetical protein N7495_008180 [Penicillium taxi]